MKFLHSNHSVAPEFLDSFNNPVPAIAKLTNLLNELQAEFNIYMTGARKSDHARSSFYAQLCTQRGLPCGSAWVVDGMFNDDKDTYYVSLPTIKKEKGSSKSSRDTRDSVKLSTLIRNLKKNKEEPTDERLSESLLKGVEYCFHVLDADRTPKFAVHGAAAISAVEHALGLDNSNVQFYSEELRDALMRYRQEMVTLQSKQSTLKRYLDGVKLIGVCESRDVTTTRKPMYLLGELAPMLDKSSTPKLRAPLVAHNTLEGTEHAAFAAMCRTTYNQSNDNELGIFRGDKYYEDLDFSTGYSNSSMWWVAIPNTAP